MRPSRSSGAAKRRSPRRSRVEVTRTRPCTSSHEQTKTWSAQYWIIRGKRRGRGRSETTTKCGGRSPDAPDWNIRGGTSNRGRHPPDWSIGGQVVARGPGLAQPGRNKEQGQPPPGLEHPRTSGGRSPQTGSSATESKRSGHEGEAVEMQRSGVEDEAEEKQRNQDEDKAQEMQRSTQVDES